MIRNSCQVMLSVLESDYAEDEPELVEKAKRFFAENERSLLDTLTDVQFANDDDEDEQAFRCLVHNDAWYNNFMFK